MAGRARLLALLGLFVGGTALGAGAAPSAYDFAGRYTRSFQNGNVEGESYVSTDDLLIVPIDARHAWVEMELAFFNGHQCSINGEVTLERNALVYRDPEMTGYGDGGPCTLRFRRANGRLTWDDQGTCTGNCGARGTLRGGYMALSSRRPVSRPDRLRILRERERLRTLR